jgi:hypothetical protein
MNSSTKRTARERCTFVADEQAMQIAYFRKNLADKSGERGRDFQLRSEHRFDALLAPIRDAAVSIFDKLGIQWHSYVGHGRSSQACCVNFLMPLADKPELVSRWIGALLDIDPPAVLPVEDEEAGEHHYVAFEYTGPGHVDYLGEVGGGVPQRGAHSTASDAAVAFVDGAGKRQLLLIEWKYSEEYRSHKLSEDKTFDPDGPVRSDFGLGLTDFFHEPFYQFLRQQMLAWQIERHPRSGFDRVRVVHISPSGNRALHAVTAPRLRSIAGVDYSDAFDAYRACLTYPEDFLERSIERAFAPLSNWSEADWLPALADRYPSLTTIAPRDPA